MAGCVLRYDGKKGVTYTIRFEHEGKQVRERLGRASDGWTPRKAKAALQERLHEVRKDDYRKPSKTTFGTFAANWADEHCDANDLKRSTRHGYNTIARCHLLPAFGHLRVEDVTVGRIEAHLAAARKAGVAPASLHRQLACLSLIMKKAARDGLVRENPVLTVRRPKKTRRRNGWRILTSVEVRVIERSFDELIGEAASARDRDDLLTARSLFVVVLATGIRRGEALGLRWRFVQLANPEPDGPTLEVAETWVRNAADTPKSEAGERTIPLGKHAAEELFQQRGRSAFNGDDELVWPNPRTGSTFMAKRFGELFQLALYRAGINERVRPFHDLRHSSISHGAAAGMSPAALMARAGHSSYTTTQIYINLSGEIFREEATLLEDRMFAGRTTATASRPA